MAWSDLPPELLALILERLPLPDFLRFGSVCSSWRSVSISGFSSAVKVPQPPWLLLPSAPTYGYVTGSAGSARCFSLSEQRVYTIPQSEEPPLADCLSIGSSNGWLITADSMSELSLLNPITGSQIELPSVTTFPFIDVVRDSNGQVTSYALNLSDEIPPESFAPDRLRYFLFEKAILSPNKSKSSFDCSWSPLQDDYTVMLIHNPLFRLAYCEAGDKSWKLIETPDLYWVDAICSSTGQIYTLESMGRVEAWYPDGNEPIAFSKTIAPSLGYFDCTKYLIELLPGHLLQVHRWRDAQVKYKWEPRPEYVEYTTTKVEIFEWKLGAKAWVSIKGLSNRALFLGKNSSFCVSLSDCPELRANCVYFTDDCLWSYEKCHDVAPDVGIFDLGNGSYKPCCSYNLLWKWPPPIWITPTVQ